MNGQTERDGPWQGLNKGAHVLYVYNEKEKYAANLLKFVIEGIESEEAILLIEEKLVIENVIQSLESMGKPAGYPNFIHAEIIDFYLADGGFDFGSAEKLDHMLLPFFKEGLPVRTWGALPIIDSKSSLDQLKNYECNCDPYILKNKLLSVCAYNGLMLPAYLQNELLKVHSHLMTDTSFSLSPLYESRTSSPFSLKEIGRLLVLDKQNKKNLQMNGLLMKEKSIRSAKQDTELQSEDRIRSVIDHLPIPIIIQKESKILYQNEIARIQFLDVKPCADGQLTAFFKIYNRSDDSSSSKNLSHKFQSEERGERNFLINSVSLIVGDGMATLHSFVDITHEKENEMLMIRSEKMNIVGELSASIAHELRNPLTAVKGFFQMLQDMYEGSSMYFEVIEEELSRIEQISSELLTLAKPHSENRGMYNVVRLIEDVVTLLTPQANMKNIELIQESALGDLWAECENTKIKQVFINLVKNAIESMDQSGSIKMQTSRTGESIQVQIIDEGKGMPEEALKKLGEPFYTTKEKGTGLGLMVCFQIIESHGGTLKAESKIDQGTTFTITLPAKEERIIA